MVNIRKVATVFGSPYLKRMSHTLTTGAEVIVIFDSNSSALSGAGGDGTNIGKIYVYLSGVLKATITTDVVPADFPMCAASIDQANNLHLAWRTHAGNVLYNMVAYSAGTYTAGTNQTLYTFASNYTISSMDIDTLGDAATPGYAIVALYAASTTGTQGARIQHYFVKNSVVFTGTPLVLATNDSPVTGTMDITVGGMSNTIASNTGIYAIAATQALKAGGDKGDLMYTFTVNTSTGAWISTSAQYRIGNAGIGAGKRRYLFFSDSTSNFLQLTGTLGGTSTFFLQFTVTTGNIRTDSVTSRTSTMSATNKINEIATWSTIIKALVSGTYYYAYYIRSSTGDVTLTNVASVSASNVFKWTTMNLPWSSNTVETSPGAIGGGNNRNFAARPSLFVFFNKPGASYQAETRPLNLASAPVMVKPAASEVVTDSTPAVSAMFKLVDKYPQLKYQMQYQLATDIGFTTNLRTFKSAAAYYPTNTTSPGVNISDVVGVPDANTLSPQGTWYIRAAEVDSWGNVGAYCSARSFTLAHPPAAKPTAPLNDAYVAYGSGAVTVGWSFSDPSPTDYQTAYQITVTLASDGSAVVDSGKVTSTVNSGTVTVPIGFKDLELRYTVTVWDSDDVAGVPSDYNYFYVSDAPTPAITGPTGTVTTSIPGITWTSGVAGAKTQTKYRVQVSQGSTTLFDSNWQPGVATSYAIPAGINISNLQTYTVTVSVQDSVGLQGVTTATFSTNWVAAGIASSLRAYLYEFERKGYVHLGWDSTTVDADFFAWKLYRKVNTDAAWTLVGTFSDLQPAYSYRDLFVASNVIYQYIVTQVVNRFGDMIESPLSGWITVRPINSKYWLLDPLQVLDPVPLTLTTADSLTHEHDEAVYNILGAGRHVDEGDDLGVSGQLTVEIRPTFVSLVAGTNYLPNPAQQLASDGNNPDGWSCSTTSGESIAYLYDEYLEPAPCNKQQVIRYILDKLTNAQSIKIICPRITIANTDWVAGTTTITFSGYFAQPPSAVMANTVSAVYNWYAADGVTHVGATDITTAMTQVDTYEPTNTLDSNTGNWKRWSCTIAVPAGAVFFAPSYYYKNNTAGVVSNVSVYFGGGAATTGTTLIPQFDGDAKGAYWAGTPNVDPAVSTGYYLPRYQVDDIEEIRSLDRPIYMRNPFGDVWLVSIGSLASDRVAGVGTDEFTNLTIAYREVAF